MDSIHWPCRVSCDSDGRHTVIPFCAAECARTDATVEAASAATAEALRERLKECWRDELPYAALLAALSVADLVSGAAIRLEVQPELRVGQPASHSQAPEEADFRGPASPWSASRLRFGPHA